MKPDWTRSQTAAAKRMRELQVPYVVIGGIYGRTGHAVKRHLQYVRERDMSS